MPREIIGVDVAKDWIDAQPYGGRPERIAMTPGALATFAEAAARCGALVVFEASGGYDRPLAAALETAGVEHVRLDPAKARQFARATGHRAKTDRLDARAPWPGVSNTMPSNEAAFRRAVRAAIRKSALTKSEQAVALAIANLWFHHRPRGEMHPGREKVARMAVVSVKTVTRTMSKLTAAGCLIALSHTKGGRAATRYRLHPLQLMVFCGAKLPAWVEGELTPLPTGNVPLSEAGVSRFTGDKMSHGIDTVAKRSSGTSKTQIATSLRIVGGRHA